MAGAAHVADEHNERGWSSGGVLAQLHCLSGQRLQQLRGGRR